MRRFPSLPYDAWSALLVLALTVPMWRRPGYGLARDLVFTPRYPWGPDAVGMGDALPRAVPLDALLALLGTVADGRVLFRVLVPGVLLLAACGAHRLVRDLPGPARVVATTVAVWNPYVVERLATGQWALLAGYAALLWLAPALRRAASGEGDLRDWLPSVVLWCCVGALTPTGGLLVLLLVVASAAVELRGRPGRAGAVVAVALLVQLPWVLPGLLGSSVAVSDAGGVAAFAARAERSGGVLPSLLTGGGIWNRFAVPASQGSWFGHLLTVASVLVLVVAARRLWTRWPALVVAAGLGLLAAALAHLPGGPALLRLLVEQVPGAGLLRDGQKFLAPYVVLLAAAWALALTAAAERARARAGELAPLLLGVVALLPLALMPDAAVRTWPALRPVAYPADLAAAVRALERARPGSGDLLTLPFASYRRFRWANDLSAADPLARWVDRPVVVNDALAVTRGALRGEDGRARAVGRALRQRGDVAAGLRRLGIGWVLTYDDQPRPRRTAALAAGLTRVGGGRWVTLWRVPDGRTQRPERGPVRVVAAVDGAWVAAGVTAAVLVLTRRRRRSVVRGGPEADSIARS